jgi:hypothetical protein
MSAAPPPAPPPTKPPPSRGGAILFGLLFAAMGAPFVAAWAGLIPTDPVKLTAPLWMVGSAGLALMLAGLSFGLGAAAPARDADGGLPPSAPARLRLAQDGAMAGVLLVLAMVATWAAIGPGEREAMMTTSVAGRASSEPANPTVARIAFGVGALACWYGLWSFVRHALAKFRRGA